MKKKSKLTAFKGRSRENVPVDRFFLNFHCSQIMNYLCQKCQKSVENYPDFEKLAHVIPHVVQGFIVKNIEGE